MVADQSDQSDQSDSWSKSKSKSKSGSKSGVGIGIGSRPAWHLALTHCLNLDAEYCQRRNNMDALRGLLWPNPIPRPFDTDTE